MGFPNYSVIYSRILNQRLSCGETTHAPPGESGLDVDVGHQLAVDGLVDVCRQQQTRRQRSEYEAEVGTLTDIFATAIQELDDDDDDDGGDHGDAEGNKGLMAPSESHRGAGEGDGSYSERVDLLQSQALGDIFASALTGIVHSYHPSHLPLEAYWRVPQSQLANPAIKSETKLIQNEPQLSKPFPPFQCYLLDQSDCFDIEIGTRICVRQATDWLTDMYQFWSSLPLAVCAADPEDELQSQFVGMLPNVLKLTHLQISGLHPKEPIPRWVFRDI